MRKQLILVSAIIITILLHTHFCIANLVTNNGFETGSYSTGDPTGYGYWMGDYGAFVNASDGINPLEGSRMFKFIYATSANHATSSDFCTVVQIIDVGLFQDIISNGDAVAIMSSRFNRVSGDSQTDTRFGLKIYAFAGNPSSFPTQLDNDNELAFSGAYIYADADIDSWEYCTAQLAIPVNTDFIAIDIRLGEDVFNDTSGVEFDGHYADAVTLTIIPEPTTLLLFGFGSVLLTIGRGRWKTRQDRL